MCGGGGGIRTFGGGTLTGGVRMSFSLCCHHRLSEEHAEASITDCPTPLHLLRTLLRPGHGTAASDDTHLRVIRHVLLGAPMLGVAGGP